jgi:predicted MFS family arabinose efflux permease
MHHSGERAATRRGRVAVSLLFLAYGTILGAWTAQIPAIKRALGLSDGELSIGLLAFAGGAILGMQVSGGLVDRLRSGRIMVPAVFADGAVLVLPALATGLVGLAACLFVFGAVHGTLNVSMNVNAVEVQRAYGRPIITSCHAVYSVGGFLGAAIGGLFAAGGVSPAVTFGAVAAGVAVIGTMAARWALPGGSDPEPGERGGAVPGVLFLGVLVFCCLVGEGAAADWSTVYLRDTLGSGPGFAAAAYAAFSIMMMAGRLTGDRLAAAVGPVRLVRGCGVLAGAGLGLALLAGNPVAGVIGFGCLGAGLSCIAPQVFGAAGNQDPAHAGQAIARVASLGFLGFVVGPVVIGAAAQIFGLSRALAVPALLALFVAFAAPALRIRQGR